MTPTRFDALVRRLASRRALLGSLAALPLRPAASAAQPHPQRHKKKCKHGRKPCKDANGKRHCVDLETDPNNCGGCGQACAAQQSCRAGQCQGAGGGCTPNCQGNACGDDGCGGSCGRCQPTQTCQNGHCVAAGGGGGGGCTPTCQGKACGDDGCGGSCGDCPSGQSCQAGRCVGCRTAADCPAPGDLCRTATCANGVCGTMVTTGAPCDDGDPCTEDDACHADGSCAGTPKDCSALADACHAGLCKRSTGACVAVPANEGQACAAGRVCCGGGCLVPAGGRCGGDADCCSPVAAGSGACARGVCCASGRGCFGVECCDSATAACTALGCCNSGVTCGPTCCTDGMLCGEASTGTCCPPGQVGCRGSCCQSRTAICYAGECCESGVACGGLGCCQGGERCVDPDHGTCAPIQPGG